jgi:alkylhydroperoxidase family enzyme
VRWLEDPAQLSDHQRLARDYTLQLMQDSNRVSDAMFNAVQQAFGDGGTVELTMLVGYINMLNMFNNALQNRYHGELSQ